MIFDSDAHVEENVETFAALEGREDLAKALPRITEGANRAFWIIEGKVLPKLVGKGVFTFGTPHRPSEGEHEDLARKTSRSSQEMTNPAARLKTMDEEGIEVSVVFPTLFLVYPVADNPLLLNALCRAYNEWIAGRCASTNGRIRWIATLPLPDVSASVEELEHAKRLGACGFLMLGTAETLLLDNPRLDPLYATAERLNIPVCVHVGWAYPPLTALYDHVFRSQLSAFVLPIFMAFVSILTGGVLDRFPKLKVGFFEAGVEWVPYWVDKIERLHRQPPGGTLKKELPEKLAHEYIEEGRVYFSCELDEKRIAEVVRDIGDECILYASDLPHAHRVFNAVKLFTKRSDVNRSTKEKILGKNGERFFSS
jgi:predicted TIM-barrel fold metal-dependent hydrolase